MAAQISKNFGKSGKRVWGQNVIAHFLVSREAEELCLRPNDQSQWEMQEGESKVLRTKPYAF